MILFFFFFFQAEDGIRDTSVTGVQTCALPIPAGRCRPVPLPSDVRDDMTSSRKESRLAVVGFLDGWVTSSHIGRVLAAEAALKQMADTDDSISVQQAARATLERLAQTGKRVTAPGTRLIVL